MGKRRRGRGDAQPPRRQLGRDPLSRVSYRRVYPAFARNSAAALAIGRPAVHLVMPSGLGSGTPVIQHGHFGEASGRGAGVVVECGQHFQQASADVAIDVARRFLAHFGLLAQEPAGAALAAPRRFELLHTVVIKTPEFRFVRPCIGFEVFAQGELIATDGPDQIRAPCDDCTILIPARAKIGGRAGVDLPHPPV